jgi:uncharacterized protein
MKISIHLYDSGVELNRVIFILCSNGYVDRVREVLAQNPELAKAAWQGESLLFWLPEDEAQALAVVDLLLANGAIAAARGPLGRTPADAAERRGLLKVAARPRAAARTRPTLPSRRRGC